MGEVTTDELVAQMAEEATRGEAYREVEKLADVTAIPSLIERIGAERDERVRADLHFMLGHIGRNTGDPRVAAALVERLAAEADQYVLTGILEALERQPSAPDCGPVVALTRDPRWLVRNAAILALGSCDSPEAEEALLAVLDTSEEAHDLVYATTALGRIGTPRALPALTRLALHGSSEDVKMSALAALIKIGDERAIAPVIAGIEQIVSRTRTAVPSELITGLEFLLRYAATDERIPALFRMIREKRVNRLSPEEQRWMEEHPL